MNDVVVGLNNLDLRSTVETNFVLNEGSKFAVSCAVGESK